MPKKRSKSKVKQKSNLHTDIKGILLITIGILTFLSIFMTKTTGIVGQTIKRLLFALIGLGAYVFPFLVLFIGICYLAKRGNISFNKKFYGIMILIVNTLLFIQMIVIDTYYINNNVSLGIKKLFNTSDIYHGGIISYLIDIPLYRLFGATGCYIIFFAIYIICFIVISQFSLSEYTANLRENYKKRRELAIKEAAVSETEAVPETTNTSKSLTEAEKENSKIKIIDFMKKNDLLEKNKKELSSPIIEDSSNIQKELEKEILQHSSTTNVDYKSPSVELLNSNNNLKLNKDDKKELLNNANKLVETLSSFGVDAKVIQVTKGPSVTRFELQPSAGVKVSKIVNLADDIALNLAASGVRIEAPIPGKAAIGIEVPNKDLLPVSLREVIESEEFASSKNNLSFCLGKDIAGNCVVSDMTKMPHLLIAGATGSGKSVCINTLIVSLLYKYSPEQVKLLLIDPKVVELNVYNGIPHLLIPVVTEPKKAAGALNWAVNEMTKRYKLFADNNVRNIEGYNELVEKGILKDKLPLIVMIIDELADLMMVCPNDIEDYIGRLAQMARAAGMHLVIATQRPSVDVITGVIKANIPSRISFAVSSQIDSRTILDSSGAEKLLGKGDMLFYPVGEAKPMRIQGAFISEGEVEKVVNFIKDQGEEIQYRTEILDQINTSTTKFDTDDLDELFFEAANIGIDLDQISTSLLQRKLKIGYSRAARIIDQMEEKNIISPRDGTKARKVLVSKEELKDIK